MSAQPKRRRLEVEDIGEVTVVNFTDKKILDEQNIQVIGEQLVFSLSGDRAGASRISYHSTSATSNTFPAPLSGNSLP